VEELERANIMSSGIARDPFTTSRSGNRKLLTAALLAGLALYLLPASGRATVLLSENFDGLPAGPSATSGGAFQTIAGTNVDIVGSLNGSFFPDLVVAPSSGNAVDMDGTGGNPQGILQSKSAITLLPGVSYLLSFDLVGSQRGDTASTTVTFGPYSQTFDLASGGSGIVSDAVITVPSSTNAFLTFTSNTPGQMGNLLDNISVVSQAPDPIPEPASILLLGLGLIGLGTARRATNRI
jgi:hypothetical protein